MSLQELQTRFFQDPQWNEMEDIILKYINPLIDMSTIDTKQPAEHVKAEIIGRVLAYNTLTDFLNSSKIISREIKRYKNPFE